MQAEQTKTKAKRFITILDAEQRASVYPFMRAPASRGLPDVIGRAGSGSKKSRQRERLIIDPSASRDGRHPRF
jgi:hypothetical protein